MKKVVQLAGNYSTDFVGFKIQTIEGSSE